MRITFEAKFGEPELDAIAGAILATLPEGPNTRNKWNSLIVPYTRQDAPRDAKEEAKKAYKAYLATRPAGEQLREMLKDLFEELQLTLQPKSVIKDVLQIVRDNLPSKAVTNQQGVYDQAYDKIACQIGEKMTFAARVVDTMGPALFRVASAVVSTGAMVGGIIGAVALASLVGTGVGILIGVLALAVGGLIAKLSNDVLEVHQTCAALSDACQALAIAEGVNKKKAQSAPKEGLVTSPPVTPAATGLAAQSSSEKAAANIEMTPLKSEKQKSKSGLPKHQL